MIASGGEGESSGAGSRGQTCSGVPRPPNPATRTSPSESFILWTEAKKKRRCCTLFFRGAFFFSFFFFKNKKISPYLCLVVVCVWRGIFTSCLSVSPVSQREALTLSLSCTTTRLLVLLDLWRRNPVYYRYTRRRTFFEEPLVFRFLAVSRCGKKKKKIEKEKRHVAFIISSLAASATWWLNVALNKCCF